VGSTPERPRNVYPSLCSWPRTTPPGYLAL
jgi:hypothetical protein